MKSLKVSTILLSVAAAGFLSSADAQIRTNPPGKLFFEGDIVRHMLETLQPPFCVLQSQFKRGEAVAFRQRVLLPDGNVADNKALKSVEVELGNGQKIPMRFARHGMPPKNYDSFWSAHWEVPKDFPTGSLGYKIVATMNDGTVVTWEPITRDNSQLTVIPGEPNWAPKKA